MIVEHAGRRPNTVEGRMMPGDTETVVLEPGAAGSRRPPIDLDHLRHQTFGNQELQVEVLSLFRDSSANHLERLKSARTITERREVAHSLTGAARGIGAFAVASIASDIERSDGRGTDRMKTLEQAVGAARTFVADFLSG